MELRGLIDFHDGLRRQKQTRETYFSGSEKSLLTIPLCFGCLGESKKMEFQLAMVSLNCDHSVVILYMKMDYAVSKNEILKPICNTFLLERDGGKTIKYKYHPMIFQIKMPLLLEKF